jgi:hypothetical protein
VDAFEQYVRGGLERMGLEVEEMDLEIMRYVDQLYGPELQALMEADLAGMWAENDLDPSRAPSS